MIGGLSILFMAVVGIAIACGYGKSPELLTLSVVWAMIGIYTILRSILITNERNEL